MKKRFLMVFVIFALISAPAFSRDNTCGEEDNDGGPGNPFCEGDTDTPLDSGVGALIGISALYGLKKLRDCGLNSGDS